MAYFAELNFNKQVIDIKVVADSDAPDELSGIRYLKDLLGEDKKWKQYNKQSQDGGMAGVGYTYIDGANKFCPPQPFPSWVLDEEKYVWKPPVPIPDESKRYSWDEASTSWKEI